VQTAVDSVKSCQKINRVNMEKIINVSGINSASIIRKLCGNGTLPYLFLVAYSLCGPNWVYNKCHENLLLYH
jgi:hypothetical protein